MSITVYLLTLVLMAPSPLVRFLDDLYVLLHPSDTAAAQEFADGDENDGGRAPGGQPDTFDESDDAIIPEQPASTKGPIQSSIVAPLRQQLIVYTAGNLANLQILITGEVADPVSGVRTLIGAAGRGFTLPVRSDRSVKIDTLDLPAGSELKALSVSTAFGTTPVWGNCFVVVKRARILDDGTAVDVERLVSTYVTQFKPAGWPGGTLIDSTDGPGLDQTINYADPGGPSLIVNVPLGATWQILAAHFTNLTDGVAGNRTPVFGALGVNFLARADGEWQGPGGGYTIMFAPSLLFGFDNFNGPVTAPLMDNMRLGQNAAISFAAFQADPGDRVIGCFLRVREWLVFQQ